MVRVLRVDADDPDPAVIAEAAAVLARGGLVAFPTETVYGLGARGLRAEHVARIFAAKGRPRAHPLILHVDAQPMAETLAAPWPAEATTLARAFWPGPLAMIVPRAAHVPDAVTGGLDTVALRAPRHPVALALVRAVGEPLAAPSANAHMHVSPSRAEHVVASLGDAVDLVLDAGPTAHGIESTVLDLTRDPPRVLRPGALSLEALRGVVPRVVFEAATVADADASRASPGMASKHYAPRAHVVVVAESDVAAALHASARAGAIVFSPAAQASARGAHHAVVLEAEAQAYARDLFAALYAIDDAGCDVVVIERVPDAPSWWAVRDRLRRAATT